MTNNSKSFLKILIFILNTSSEVVEANTDNTNSQSNIGFFFDYQ